MQDDRLIYANQRSRPFQLHLAGFSTTRTFTGSYNCALGSVLFLLSPTYKGSPYMPQPFVEDIIFRKLWRVQLYLHIPAQFSLHSC